MPVSWIRTKVAVVSVGCGFVFACRSSAPSATNVVDGGVMDGGARDAVTHADRTSPTPPHPDASADRAVTPPRDASGPRDGSSDGPPWSDGPPRSDGSPADAARPDATIEAGPPDTGPPCASPPCVLNAFMGTGQSLSQGATAVPLASTYPVAPLTAFMTNLGVRPVADDFGCVATTLAASAITSLVPLQESVASIDGETIASGAMNTIAATLLGHPSQFVLVTPKYFLGYELGDAVHLPAVGEEQLGEKYGEAFFETFFAEPKTPWKPLYATSAAIAGPSVTLHYTVPFPPIVLDTTWVNASYSLSGVVDGFHYTDDSASAPVVTDVAITDPGGEVTRGPSAAPAGTFTTRTRSPRDSRGARSRTRPRSRARSRPRTGARSSSTRPSRRASSTPGKSFRSPG